MNRYAIESGLFSHKPFHHEEGDDGILLILDGLDELATQGRAAAETARAFIRELDRYVQRKNHYALRIQVVLSGRELVVQENETEFRRPREIINLLPYAEISKFWNECSGAKEIVGVDKRREWWDRYRELTGRECEGLEEILGREDLFEITSQPLLNFLFALSFSRGELDFAEPVTLNMIYADLVRAVYERGYEGGRTFSGIRGMTLEQFIRILEEVGIAAWHGDGRTTTVKEIESHCKAGGLERLLEIFKEGAEAGITRLLAAFFFRRHGRDAQGDATFAFTHKSFGEYLAALRIVRGLERIMDERNRREKSFDSGWSEVEALRHWLELSGSSEMTTYIWEHLKNEIQLRGVDWARSAQSVVIALFNHVLNFGLPEGGWATRSFAKSLFVARNAEESLFVALNACALVTREISGIRQSDPSLFGAWIRRVQGQRSGPDNKIVLNCLSFVDLSGAYLDFSDLYRADFSFSKLDRSRLRYAQIHYGKFTESSLKNAMLEEARFVGCSMVKCDLEEAEMRDADFSGAILKSAKLVRAKLASADFRRAKLRGADLTGAIANKMTMDRLDVSGVVGVDKIKIISEPEVVSAVSDLDEGE